MAGSSSKSATIGNRSDGVAFFKVPREIRDEIYRLVLNGRYALSHFLPAAKNKNDLALLKVSKAIRHEASKIWLSESTFIFNIDFQHYFHVDVPSELKRQMKNVELHLENTREGMEIDLIGGGSHVKTLWELAIARFKFAEIERNELFVLVIWRSRPLEGITIDDILSPIVETFKAGPRFRTISFLVRTSKPRDWSPMDLGQLGDVAWVIKKELEPVLGPVPEDILELMSIVEFHPPQNLIDSTK